MIFAGALRRNRSGKELAPQAAKERILLRLARDHRLVTAQVFRRAFGNFHHFARRRRRHGNFARRDAHVRAPAFARAQGGGDVVGRVNHRPRVIPAEIKRRHAEAEQDGEHGEINEAFRQQNARRAARLGNGGGQFHLTVISRTIAPTPERPSGVHARRRLPPVLVS